jgi:hypothetical protein
LGVSQGYGEHQLKNMKPLTESEYKGVKNAWINPDGELFECGYMKHSEWAMDYITEVMCNNDFIAAMKKVEELCGVTSSAYPYEALHNIGWVRILTWTVRPVLCTRGNDFKLNHVQKDTILFWANVNGFDYQNLIDNINK